LHVFLPWQPFGPLHDAVSPGVHGLAFVVLLEVQAFPNTASSVRVTLTLSTALRMGTGYVG
jgi:hypothetical protein